MPFPAGGATDVAARTIAPKLSEALGQQVVVENRAGASGIIGVDLTAKSPPDGYTIVIATVGTISINPHLYSKMPFDPAKDLAPTSLAGDIFNVLVVHPSLPAQSVKALVALARSHPGQLNFGSSGTGAADHLAGDFLDLARHFFGTTCGLVFVNAHDTLLIEDTCKQPERFPARARVTVLPITEDIWAGSGQLSTPVNIQHTELFAKRLQ